MPNHLGNTVISATTAGITITAADVPTLATQAIVTSESTGPAARLTARPASTASTGGIKMYPGDVLTFRGNNYNAVIKQLKGTALTDGATVTLVVEFFDGFDRA